MGEEHFGQALIACNNKVCISLTQSTSESVHTATTSAL